jgi:type IV pilus assembly protein PilY1
MNFRINALVRAGVMMVAAVLLACPGIGFAQVQYSEDFTGITSNNQWFFYNGACLTAGTNTSTTSPGNIPGCKTIFTTYYSPVLSALGKSSSDSYLSGGDLGCLGVSPSSGTCPSTITPDLVPTTGNANSGGALRFTNGAPYGGHENGAIVSNFVFPSDQGLQITFKTVTYHGDNQGGHGADGISFYLLDGCMPIAGGTVPSGCPASSVYGSSTFSAIGAWGGSLAYTCSNQNKPYDGLAGAYLGLGIDEWGNFLNGTSNTLGESGTSATGDNTASGGGYQPGRIGLRGAGNISWQALTNAYGSYTTSSSPYYPASLATSCYINGGTLSGGLCGGNPTDAMMAVKKTCSNGHLYNYSSSGTVNSSGVNNPTDAGAALLTNAKNTAGILDYLALPSAYQVVSGFSIANESATIRGSTLVANTSSNDANPITYQLKITQDGLLSLSFSYNGGTWQPVITGQNITSSNGPLPANFRFGFAGSTGGSTNIHEVMCFKAAPTETSQSSGGVNVYENPTIKFGTQLFLAYYFPSDWTGQLTAQTIGFDTTKNVLTIASAINWDARCVLTGVTASTGPCSTGVTSLAAEAPASRTMLTWSGSAGIPFEWSNLTSAQTTALDQGDASATSNRLSFLRGDRTNEISSTGTCPQLTSPGLPCFRKRNSVLGDIVDSSPTWVGPPQTYTASVTWIDKLYPTATAPESAGQAYTAFQKQRQGRLNVVYIGADDGFLHGFRAGSLDSNGNLVANSSTPNDGYEVLAYMPGAVVQTIHNSSSAGLDFSNTQYSHNWFVDATPASGDVFYAGVWHTWVVGGLGVGGAAVYALDVTDPSTFAESNAASTVIGEWTPSTITCTNVSNCGKNLGNTYGTPLIRRFHNGSWGVIFGNGYGSQNNTTAGIFIMLIDPTSGKQTFYYLATPSLSGNPVNGISSPASLDVELDHIVDYIYAGDLQGNIWRFDVTSTDPANWAVSASSPLFTTPGKLPITTGMAVGALHGITLTNLGGEVIDSTQPVRVIINFGTGRVIPPSLTASAQYASGTQYLFGIWDWDMKAWNALSSVQTVALTGPRSISLSNLQPETITTATSGTTTYRKISSPQPVCWVVPEPLDASSLCPTPGTQFGWSMALPGTNEQIIFNPVLSPDGELVINTYIPVQDTPLSCTAATAGTGFSMAVQPDTGNGLSNDIAGKTGAAGGYFSVNTNNGTSTPVDGIQLNGTGIPWFLSSGQKSDNNAQYLITQTASGAAPPTQTNRHSVVAGKRVNWIQRR